MERVSWATLLVAAAVTTSAAQTQERMEVLAAREGSLVMADLDVAPTGFGTVRQATPVPFQTGPAYMPTLPVALSGGRYLAWVNVGSSGSTSRTVSVFDRRTRQSFLVSLFPGGTDVLVPDPLRPRLFVLDRRASRVHVVDARTLTVRVVAEHIEAFAYAADVDQLFGVRSPSSGPPLAVIIDVDTASEIRSVPLEQEPEWQSFLVSRDGRRVWAYGRAVSGDPGQPSYVAAYNAATGEVLARSAPMAFTRPLQFDERRGVLLAPWNHEGLVAVLDPETLSIPAVVRVDGPPADGAGRFTRSFQLMTGRGATGAYVIRQEQWSNPRRCERLDLDLLDVTGQRRGSLHLQAALGLSAQACLAYGTLLRTPDVPPAFAATVRGRDVTLTWDDPGDSSGFEVQAGAAPGATFLTQRVGSTTMVVYASVPSGTYYVRVRAYNELGSGPHSHEVAVIVP